jgi:hypothetical protein
MLAAKAAGKHAIRIHRVAFIIVVLLCARLACTNQMAAPGTASFHSARL